MASTASAMPITAQTALQAMSPIAFVIKEIYKMGEAVNDYINKHIEELERSENPTIASTGRVLKAAKEGFAIGYISSVAIIATGQLILGNSFSAIATIATAATLTNPIAMTCAAVGAIYYGWNALSPKERDAILTELTTGLEMGYELLKAIIEFTIHKIKEFLSPQQLAEFKKFIKTQAEQFGNSLYDITNSMGDMVKGTAEKVGNLAGQAADITASATKIAVNYAGSTAGKVVEVASETAKGMADKIGRTKKD